MSGVHHGKPFVNEVYLGCTGGAGTPWTDGWLTILHVGNAGMCYQDSIEIDELRHPIFVHARRLIPDSEGAGRFRGALGAYSGICARGLCDDGRLRQRWQRQSGAWYARGLPGARSAQYRRNADGSLEPVPACAEVVIGPDETMVSISGGGGGYGHPHERDPARVVHDVREGWVSRERAASVYGVVVTKDNTLDHERTVAVRRKSA